MIEEEAPPTVGGDMVLYDFLKHLTSLCLFSLGGVAALADKIHGRSWATVIAAMAVIGAAAFCSFYATSMVVESQVSGKPVGSRINRYRHAAPLLLSVGIGMFLFLFARARGG